MKWPPRKQGRNGREPIPVRWPRPGSLKQDQISSGLNGWRMSFWKKTAASPGQVSAAPIWQNEQGVAAVEFALVLSVLVFLLLAATDLALAIYTQMKIGNAARAGTEYAAIHGWNSTGITTAVTSATSLTVTASPSTYCGCATASGVAQQTCGSTCSAGGIAGTYVSVTAAASYRPIFNALWGSILTNHVLNMSATSVTRIN